MLTLPSMAPILRAPLRDAQYDMNMAILQTPLARLASLPQPSLEKRLLAGLGKLRKMLFHASLDPALAWWNLTAELPYIGFTGLRCRPGGGPTLRHRT
jgi:hypothetical protein